MTEQNWLGENQLSLDIWNKKYRVNQESFEDWLNRVSGDNEDVKQLIKEKKFLFGGRTLSNRGVPNSGSYSNCYSEGFIPDSLEGIMKANTDLAMTYKAQGGQGLSLSKIRPKGTLIGSRFKSDGIVPFMEMFNKTTESISQGGCISEDQLVLTDKGLRSIKDIQIGDKVWTKLKYIPVNYKYDKGIKEVYKVTTLSGYSIETTIDHKFNTDGFNSKHLSDLKIGDNVVIIIGDSSSNNIFLPKYYTLATFLANGTLLQKENGGNITFTDYITTGKTVVAKYIESITGAYPRIEEHEKFYRIYLNRETISKLGYTKKYTETIEIPEDVMCGNNDIKISFLAGLLDTDGTVYSNKFKYSTISEKFSNQLLILLNSLGFLPTVSIQYRENRKPLYEIHCSIFQNTPYIPSLKYGKNITGTVSNCRKTTPFTIDNLGIIERTGHLKKLSRKNNIGYYTYLRECSNYYVPCILEPIVSIEQVGERHVYDLSLESEHYFSCNGFYVSNSRKGALLMSVDVWHKEAPTFITIKRDLNKINKANLSVEIDDDFMSYVATKRSTPVNITRTYEDKTVEYDVNVQDLYNLICESAFKSAEPGIIFTNRFRNYNLMEFVDDYQIETCNPCGR